MVKNPFFNLFGGMTQWLYQRFSAFCLYFFIGYLIFNWVQIDHLDYQAWVDFFESVIHRSIITILFLNKFKQQPLHLFGSFGIVFLSLGFLAEITVLYYKYFLGDFFSKHMALLIFGVMLIVIGIQFFSIGLLGELITRSNQDNENRVKSKYDKI